MDYWTRVRHAFVDKLSFALEKLEVEQKRGGGHDHVKVVCRFCRDSGGSASIHVHSGHFRCFQCGKSEGLFDWVAAARGLASAWMACKELGTILGVEPAVRGRGRPPVKFTSTLLELSSTALWDSPAAAWVREELAARGFTQEELSRYCLGYYQNGLVFPALDPSGELRERSHLWRGPKIEPKWIWTKGAGDPNYLWPESIPPSAADAPIWLCEGEWDCLVLREKFKVDAYTWTGGAGGRLVPAKLPHWMRARSVVVVYDNDTWQGPDLQQYFAPDERRMRELVGRRENLLENVCEVLRGFFGCKVELATVPLDPRKSWGGDVRDWWKEGGKDLGELPRHAYESIDRDEREPAVEADLATGLPTDRPVSVVVTPQNFDATERRIPKFTEFSCPMGTLACCPNCGVHDYGKRVWHWDDHPVERALVWSARNPERRFLEMMRQPRSCTRLELKHSKESDPIAFWQASEYPSGSSTAMVTILSESRPPTFGILRVHGKVYLDPTRGASLLVTTRVEEVLEQRAAEVAHMYGELRSMTPWDSDDRKAIDEYLERRYADLGANVTAIYGQRKLHFAFDLVAHSPVWIDVDGRTMRGWVDATVVGVTRSGKSEVGRRLSDHYGVGIGYVSQQGTMTKAGFTAATVKTDMNQLKIRPGLMPLHHGRMVVLDEAHSADKPNSHFYLMESLQEARDHGELHVLSAAGWTKLACAVRLLTLANPSTKKGFDSYRYPCEVVREVYRRPEQVSRLDFLVVVDREDAEVAYGVPREKVGHSWTARHCSALVARAWLAARAGPVSVRIPAETLDQARSYVESWAHLVHLEVPLYTGPEKLLSLLRIAAAIANLCFSHPYESPLVTLVRPVHVDVAAAWLVETWERSGYLMLCQMSQDRDRLPSPCRVEHALVERFADFDLTRIALEYLLKGGVKQEVQIALGLQWNEADEWFGNLVRQGALEVIQDGTGVRIEPTVAGGRLIRAILQRIDEDPDGYHERRKTLARWFENPMNATRMREPEGLEALQP